jgi:putative heme-binding domain-containing protein
VIEWSETDNILATVRSKLGDPSRVIRSAALEAVRESHDPGALPLVRARWPLESDDGLRGTILDVLASAKDEDAKDLLDSIFRDPRIRVELRKRAVDTACAIRAKGMIELLTSIVEDRTNTADQVLPCLAALGRLREAWTGACVAARADDPDESVREAVPSALVEIRGADAAPELLRALRDPSSRVRQAALRGFARLRLRVHVPDLLPLVADVPSRDDALLALASTPDARALDAYLLGLASSQRGKPVRDACAQALSAIREEVRTNLEALHAEHRLDEVQLAAVQRVFQEPQPILRWHVMGPFECGREPGIADEGIDLARRYTGLDGKDQGWIEHLAEPRDGYVDLVKLLSGKANVSAWAYAEVAAPVAAEVDMTVGSDDGVAVWVGGAAVHDHPDDRAWAADQDRFRVRLAASDANPVLLRVVNNTGGWAFNAKVAGVPSGPLFDRAATAPGLEDYRAYAQEHRGDPARGFQVFRASRDESMCIRCHTVYGVGEKVGPDLSDIGARYGREEILSSILEPSLRIAEGYRSTSLELADGRVVFGMVRQETADEIEIHDTNGELRTIDKLDVDRRGMLDTSVMPDGLWSTLSKEDLVDLLEWLTTLRGR